MKTKTTNTRYIKGTALSLIAATFLLTGCGSSGIDDVYERDAEATTQADYTVQVVDDAVLNSTIISNECSGFEEKGNGYYTLTGCSARPKSIMADGGYIAFSDANVSMGFPLIVNTNMIEQSTSYTATPLTTLLATVNDYAELVDIKNKLGFSSVQDLFEDDDDTREMQRTLNSFFIEAKENGVNLNNFADFTKDFRDMLKTATGTTPLEVVTSTKGKLKTDFDSNPSKYTNKYGVVFSGFVTNTDYTSSNGAEALLKNIGNKFGGDKEQIVFSGFIFDDVIGSSNSKYSTDANITIKNVNTGSYLDLNGTNKWTMANPYGNYIAKINMSDINESNSYFIEGRVTNTDNKQILLKSLLTGKEILSKFKTKLNSADIADLTISNVTSAKAVVLEKQTGGLTRDVDSIIEAKKLLEEEKQLVTNIAAGFKTIIDGNATTNGDTYTYISGLTTNTNFNPTEANMLSQLAAKKEEILANKTLLSQLASTDYEKFILKTTDLQGKKVVFKKANTSFDTTLLLFNDMSFILREKDDDNNPVILVGSWAINEGDLILTQNDGTIVTVTLSSLTMGGAKIENSKVIGAIPNPKGKINIGSTNIFFDVKELSNIDLTKESAPVVKFTDTFVKGKTVYSVYPEVTNGTISSYQDSLYRFATTGGTVEYTEDIKNETNKTTPSYTINTDGILTINGATYKIIQSYPTKLIVVKNNLTNYPIELFYSAVDAAAAKEIKTYDNSDFKTAPSSWSTTKSGSSLSTISDDQTLLRAIPANSTDYTKSSVGKITPIGSSVAIGIKGEITVTENWGDSQRQRGVISTRYSLPNCSGVANQGSLVVNVQVRNNKVTYMLQLKDLSTGTEYDILESPVTMVEENTLNKKYSVMTLMLENQIAIQLSDGVNAYYQYIDLPTLWGAKPTHLKSYKYPTALANGAIFAVLNDDGTGKLYEGKMNTPITVKMGDFFVINGEDTNTTNYEGGQSSVCTTTTSSGGSTTTTNTTIQTITNSFEDTSLSNFELWTDNSIVSTTQYASLGGVDVSFLGDSTGFGDLWYNTYNTNSRHLGKSTVLINPLPTATTHGTITFTDLEKSKFLNGSTWITKPENSYPKSKKLTKINSGIYQIFDDLNSSAQEEIKFVKEYSVSELNQLFSNIAPDVNVTFNGNDKGTMIVVKALKDYYDWNEPEQNWGASVPTTYSSLNDFVSNRQAPHSMFISKENGTTNTGIAFGSSSGVLVEVSNGIIINDNAGYWSITNDILNVTITTSGYDYTPAFTVKDGVVWRGEKVSNGEIHSGILYNSSALQKLNDYFTTIYNQ